MTDTPEIPTQAYDREAAWAKINARGYVSDAGISQDGVYRYWLTRDWSQLSMDGQVLADQATDLHPSRTLARQVKLMFVMFNPSTADAEDDDPTIRRCIAFARLWGYGGIQVVNLFAYRATDPRVIPTLPLWHAVGALHPDGTTNINDRFIGNAARHSAGLGFPKVVCAWGALAKGHEARVRHVLEVLKIANARPHCLGTTKEGFPRHPLYVPNTQPMIPYEPA